MSLYDRPDVSGIVGAPDESAGAARDRQWRLGTVSATLTTPNRVTVDGRPMRYLSSYSPTVADVVVYVRIGADNVCLGKLA